VGNGRNTLFWTDRWLHGQRLDDLVPNLFGAISSRARKRTVQDALTDQRWVRDIRGALSLAVLREYLALWDLLSNFVLHPDIEDTHVWKFSPSGKYSAKSAYESLFIGATSFRPWQRIWKSWAPNSSCGWLHITDVGQLTASLEEICHIQNAARCVTKLRK